MDYLPSHILVWFEEWSGLIHNHLIPHYYIVSLLMRNGVIPPNFMGSPHDSPRHPRWVDPSNQALP
uniref:Uncharacterized protein n=1 Tax=Arundo donax TaxID=35708 RepID=A0A0A8Z0Z7_ARUDO